MVALAGALAQLARGAAANSRARRGVERLTVRPFSPLLGAAGALAVMTGVMVAAPAFALADAPVAAGLGAWIGRLVGRGGQAAAGRAVCRRRRRWRRTRTGGERRAGQRGGAEPDEDEVRQTHAVDLRRWRGQAARRSPWRQVGLAATQLRRSTA